MPSTRRLHVRRGLAVAGSPRRSLGVAALVVTVLAPRAVAEIQQFSQQFPETVGELERLPLVGGWIERPGPRRPGRATGSTELPEQFTDERLERVGTVAVSGVVSIADRRRSSRSPC